MVSKVLLGAVAGVTAAVGYCVYFDQKRRSDPLYRDKVRERRAKAKAASTRSGGMPDATDPEAMQRYFMIQLQRGEACLMNGMVEESVEHFCNAVRTSGSPSQILRILNESLPPQIFNAIVETLAQDPGAPLAHRSAPKPPPSVESAFPGMATEVSSAHHSQAGPTVTLLEDDLE